MTALTSVLTMSDGHRTIKVSTQEGYVQALWEGFKVISGQAPAGPDRDKVHATLGDLDGAVLPLKALATLAKGAKGDPGAQGLPGVNAVANDTATAAQINTAGTATDTALKAGYVPKTFYRFQSVPPSPYSASITAGLSTNAIASDVGSSVIIGGGQSGFNNVIGNISGTDQGNIGTSAHADKTALTGSNAHYSVVSGYDNAAQALASQIHAYHAFTSPAATHPSIFGGSLHSVTNGNYGAIVGGSANTVASTAAAILAGLTCSIDASSSGAGILTSITSTIANSTGAVVVGGQQVTITGAQYSVGSGLRTYVDKYGQRAHAAGWFAASGDAQSSDYTLRKPVTLAAATTLALDGAGALLVLRDTQAMTFRIMVTARAVGAELAAGWIIEGVVARGTGAASTRIVGSPMITTLGKDAGAATWAVAVSGDTTSGDLRVKVTGDGARTVRAVARVITAEVIA